MEAALKLEEKPQMVEQRGASLKPGKNAEPGGKTVRYFLGKEGTSFDKPELGQEVSSESEALVRAFQSKDPIVYVLSAFRVEAEISGKNPVLVKRPVGK